MGRVQRQREQVLKLLKEKPVTPFDAVQFGCMRLAARVHELRNEGHEIYSELIHVGDARVARYWLLKERKEGEAA